MSSVLVFLLCCIFTSFVGFVDSRHISEGLKVTLKHGGTLVGRHMESAHERYIQAFLGVPYAKPPVGDLRFRAPVPADSWEGERMAITDGSPCSQADVFGGSFAVTGDEDCLYLNVFVPQEPKTREKLPVMVWIHGGGYSIGDGTSKSYNPKKLLDHDLILVTLNYRLSTLGFLSSETLDMPGNFALKDQLMALKWVKEHISAFGGDENSITIVGESAGSVSVTYHTLSEKTKGLFHRAIASSGTFYNAWARPSPKGKAESIARKIADVVGCSVQENDWVNALTCLRSVPASNLTFASTKLFVWGNAPMPPFTIVVEPEHEDAYLTHDIQVTEYSNSLPLMIGFTHDEGIVFLVSHNDYYTNFEKFRDELYDYFPYAFNYQYIPKENEEFAKNAILDFYFESGNITKTQNLTDALTDSTFISGVDDHIRHRLSTEFPAAPTYVYEFQQKGGASNSYTFSDEFQGVCHGDDNLYLFPIGEDRAPTVIPTLRERELSKNMVDMWYNFVTLGNPSPANTYLPRWPAINSYPPKIMRIGSLNEDDPLLEMTSDYPESRAKFWRDLQPYLRPTTEQYRFL